LITRSATLLASSLLLLCIAAGAAAGSARHTYVDDANPSWAQNGTQLVFERWKGQVDPRNGECCLLVRSDLYVINTKSAGLRRLPGSGKDGEPAWSPIGDLIAFSRRKRIYVSDLNGANARPLRGDYRQHRWPAWSPDGKTIAFWRGGASSTGSIYAVGVDGRGFRRVVANADGYGGPSWSPDGTRILFTRLFNIYEVRADGSDAHALTRGRQHPAYYEPAWSPDGRRIVFRSDLGLYVMRVDGTGVHRITRTPDELRQDAHPVWAPNGERIAFAGFRRSSEEARIYTVAPNGRALTRLTQPPSR
jgi:Tol biopolymer transport system component